MAIKKGVNEIVEFLNILLKIDHDAIQELFEARGLLGLLNGYFGIYDEGPHKGWGPIMAVYDHDSKTLIRFSSLEF